MDSTNAVPIPLQANDSSKGEKIYTLLELSAPILMGIFLFLTPFSHTTALKEICFYLSMGIVLFLILSKKIVFSFHSPLTLPFALFVLWAFIGLFFALDKGNSIHDFCFHLLKYLAFYYCIVNFFNSRRRLSILSWTIVLSSGLFSLGGIIYFYGILGNPLYARLGFDPLSANYLGFVTVAAMLLALHLITTEPLPFRRLILFTCLLASTAATLFTQTRANFVALLVTAIVMIPKNKKVMIVFLPVLLAGFILTPGIIKHRLKFNNIIHNARIGINLTTIEVIKSYPVFGIGFGMRTYSDKNVLDLEKYNERLSSKFRQRKIIPVTHNSWLDIAVRTGLIGIGLYLYILVTFFKMGWHVIKHGSNESVRGWGLCMVSALIAVFIQGMFSDGMFGPQAIILYTIFAMMTIVWNLHHNKSKAVS